MIRQRNLLLIQILLFLTCTLSLSAQIPSRVTISSQITVEPDGVLAECSTDVNGGAVGLYQKVETVCSLTKDNIKLTEDWGCQSDPFIPFFSFSAPPLNAVCPPKSLTIPIVGNSTYMTSATHRIYFTPNLLGPGTPPTDPCDFRVTSVYNGNEVPHILDARCPIPPDFTPVGGLFWTFGSTSSAITTTTIDPADVTLGPKEKQQFTSSPSTNTVRWSIDPQVGTIDQSGNYLAPDKVASPQTVTVMACNVNNSSDCGHAQIDLIPVIVEITEGKTIEVFPGTIKTLHAFVGPATVKQSVVWFIDPFPAEAGDLMDFADLTVNFKANPVTSAKVAVVTACSEFDVKQCDSTTVFVPVVTITVSADTNPLLAIPGAVDTLTATVTGTTNNDILWRFTPTSGAGTLLSTGPNTVQYQAPSPAINAPIQFQVTACLADADKICSPPYNLMLNPPVVFSMTPTAWPAGQNTSITITGTGFGTAPMVRIDDLRIGYTQTSFSATSTGAAIQAIVNVPSSLPLESASLTVVDTSVPSLPQFSVPATVLPATLSVTVAPTSATVAFGSSVQFTPTSTCISANAAPCTAPPVTCSVSPALGNMNPATCLYSATARVSTSAQILGIACSAGVCSTPFSITLLPPPLPTATTIKPSTVTAGSSAFTLEVDGSNFVAGAVVRINGSARPTVFVNALQLTAAIGSADVAATGQLNITVLNPAPGSLESSPLPLTITNTPIPLISNLTPPRVIECDPALSATPCPSFKLIVNGSFFSSNARVQIDGVDCATTFISANQLTATILPANLTRSRFASIKVFNPTSGQLGPNEAPLAVFRYGDLTFDNVVNVSDLSFLANFLAGNNKPLDPTPGDVLLDGKTNVTDLNVLANFLAGNIHTLPIIPDQTAILFNAGAPVNLSPPTFAGQMVGTTSEPLSLKLTNGGPTPLSISSVNIAPMGEFVVQSNDCVSLAANASCTINVTFSPTAAGTHAAILTVVDNAGNSPQTANLSGTVISSAVPPTAAPTAATTAALSSSLGITVGPVTLAFPSQTVGTNSAFQRIRLINTGPTALSISGINIAPSGEFTESGNCGTSLAAGTSCNIDVTFSPATSGTRTATLTVTDNASNSPQTASLTGTGAP